MPTIQELRQWALGHLLTDPNITTANRPDEISRIAEHYVDYILNGPLEP